MFLYQESAVDQLQETTRIEKSITILDLILSGGIGSQIIMLALLVLLSYAMFVFVERMISILQATKVDAHFIQNLRRYMLQGDIKEAEQFCAQTSLPIARILQRGVQKVGRPMEEINKSIENLGKLEVFRLEKNISHVATIASVAPMIGFLGTVIGMILAFHQMASVGGKIDLELLSTGIYTAMTTTVGGLIVGIIAYLFYNILVARIDKAVHKIETAVNDFTELLDQPI